MIEWKNYFYDIWIDRFRNRVIKLKLAKGNEIVWKKNLGGGLLVSYEEKVKSWKREDELVILYEGSELDAVKREKFTKNKEDSILRFKIDKELRELNCISLFQFGSLDETGSSQRFIDLKVIPLQNY